jgi:hypothetical protein
MGDAVIVDHEAKVTDTEPHHAGGALSRTLRGETAQIPSLCSTGDWGRKILTRVVGLLPEQPLAAALRQSPHAIVSS